MNVTDLIKHKKVKAFLLNRNPKPQIDRSAISQIVQTRDNLNPSLTGNAFELYLRIAALKNIAYFNDEFDQDLAIAAKNKVRLQKKLNERWEQKQNITIYLNKKDYAKKIPQIQRVLSANGFSVNGTKKFNYFKIENLEDIDKIFQIYKETGIYLVGGSSSGRRINTKLPTILFEADSIQKYLQKAIKKFKRECEKYFVSGRPTKSFIESVLEFTQISSPFFCKSDVVECLSFSKDYLVYLNNLFKVANPKEKLFNQPTIFKPSLRSSDVLATPDFLVGNRILEIKTSKEFFSTQDYLQALVYLLFAQLPQNKKKWGLIKEVELYYPVFDKSVYVKLLSNNKQTKPLLKFLGGFAKETKILKDRDLP